MQQAISKCISQKHANQIWVAPLELRATELDISSGIACLVLVIFERLKAMLGTAV